MVNSSVNILLQLLRLALGNKVERASYLDLDWREAISLSFEQEVAALAVDGLQKLYEENPGLKLDIDKPELEPLKYQWFGSTIKAEENYKRVVAAAKALAQKCPIVVLKGMAIARKYPEPSHRASGDLDVFGYGGALEFTQCDISAKYIIYSDYKHFGFLFHGVLVEYHKCLIAWKSLKKGIIIEKTLQDAIGIPNDIFANDYFNALFLAVHSYLHFMLEDGISLKHICDWWVAGIGILPDVEQQRLLKAVEQFGMKEFVASITHVAKYVCDNPSTELTETEWRMLDDVLSLGRKRRFKNGHLNMVYHILFYNGWKFKVYADESNIVCLLKCVWNAISKRNL